jgi:class 3 adenylate cyclase
MLETVYNAFDKIADRRGVFKVETIGDSYVAVCGYVGVHQNKKGSNI